MITIGVLAPALKVAGIAIASEMISKLMEEHGHGGKVVFIKMIAYVSCAYITFDFWWSGLRYVANSFGVSI